ncbi:MAG: roadblock/LC7 domain-containing protein [Desulfuromonadales bacterium]|nr:roadblock/LC7 domain-containing protein [Desulfuromonadales bacterium]NIR33007.1 roadblock/LC7 domain-containing protein [Desulfuromonadales bacterium]NIS40556.1 roadblock/LC7 domain-containing protein [Desulfuromonadales bacterium]
MPFKRVLSHLLDQVPGAMGAILADWEGEMVDQVARMDDYELKVIGAYKGILLNLTRDALKRLRSASLEEMVITTDQVHTVVSPITDEYFVVLIVRREEILGRALFAIKRCVEELKTEIE